MRLWSRAEETGGWLVYVEGDKKVEIVPVNVRMIQPNPECVASESVCMRVSVCVCVSVHVRV